MEKRIAFLDYLRAIACLMVIIVHACEFYYCYPERAAIPSNIVWVSIIDSLLRPCVPLFVMASSYLLLPLQINTFLFLKRRFSRIFFPFLIFLFLYALLPAAWGEFNIDTARQFFHMAFFNFTPNAGHLWFMYMLIGIYLFMPILSPWLKQVGKKEELIFLIIWFMGTFWHYIQLLSPEGKIYGECDWNEFSAIYYLAGYIGYLILAHYIRQYINWGWKKTLVIAIPLFLIGYIITAEGFYHAASNHQTGYMLELTWRFCTPNVAMMTFSLFIIFKKLLWKDRFIYKFVYNISKRSYGMYLIHIFILNQIFHLIEPNFNTPTCIILSAILTYILSYIIIYLIGYIPNSKYITG